MNRSYFNAVLTAARRHSGVHFRANNDARTRISRYGMGRANGVPENTLKCLQQIEIGVQCPSKMENRRHKANTIRRERPAEDVELQTYITYIVHPSNPATHHSHSIPASTWCSSFQVEMTAIKIALRIIQIEMSPTNI